MNRNTLRELLLFAVAGVIGLGVDMGVLYLLAPAFGHLYPPPWNWYAARVISFICAATATWIFNRRFTFAGPHTGSLWRQWLAYLGTMIAGALLNYAVYVLALRLLSETLGPWAPAAGVALGSLAGMSINFLTARYLIFKRRHRH
ncbi:MAG: GtrA family protein [Burkholderiaceae bacterium]|jgi:putative flippase GtrA|nr:GtrA family protein [Burkholderiaceae bacterium]